MMSVILEKETHGGRVSLDMSLFSLGGGGTLLSGCSSHLPYAEVPDVHGRSEREDRDHKVAGGEGSDGRASKSIQSPGPSCHPDPVCE